MDLADRIVSTKVREGEIAIVWLGQAGFIIKDNSENIIVIDPYLTDCVERVIGFKRMTPKLIAPHELNADVLITSHDHLDHFDIDAVPILMSNNKTKILGSVTAANMALAMGIDKSRVKGMKPGDAVKLIDITIKAVYADHGELAPDALGIVLEINGITIYYAADTAYSPMVVKTAMEVKPDIIIVPINGQYGNLNSEEAARLVRDSGTKLAIPCHFWTFIIHKGEPQLFAEQMKKYAPLCDVKFVCQGELFLFKIN